MITIDDGLNSVTSSCSGHHPRRCGSHRCSGQPRKPRKGAATKASTNERLVVVRSLKLQLSRQSAEPHANQ
jgi:hypothetical protein